MLGNRRFTIEGHLNSMARVCLSVLVTLQVLTYLVSTEETFTRERILVPGRSLTDSGHGPSGASSDRQRAKRLASASDLTEEEIAIFLDKHNEYRSQVDPPASNMKYMVWEDTLATMAQQYTDMCIWAHGFPEVNISPFDPQGQNLWLVGPSRAHRRPNPASAMQSWYNEVHFYNYTTHGCQPNKPCNHYTQVVWAKSYAVGCAMSFCPISTVKTNNVWIVGCHYGVAGNYAGVRPYLTGTPCTQCESGVGQCYGNQCRLCSTHTEECVCAQACKNCGTLNIDTCTCRCRAGFHGTDCSDICENTSDNCLYNWGYPWCDEEHPYVLRKCPALCNLCDDRQDPNFVCATDAPVTNPPATDGPVTNPPATDAPVTNPPATDTPVSVAPSTNTPITNLPGTDAPVTNPPASGPITTTAAPTTNCPSVLCLHGGTFDKFTCKCTCTSEYQGDKCQHERKQARNGVVVTLLTNNTNWYQIEPNLLDIIAYILTSYCNGDAFDKCCPGKGIKITFGSLSYVTEAHIFIATGYPEANQTVDGRPTLRVMLLASPPANTELCNSGSLSRKRRNTEILTEWTWSHEIHRRAATDETYLDQNILLKAIEENTDNITSALSELNVTVYSVEAGKEEPLPLPNPTLPPDPTSPPDLTSPPDPTTNTGLIIAIVVVVSAIVLIIVAGIFIRRRYRVSKNAKAKHHHDEYLPNYSKHTGKVTMDC